MDRLTAYLRIPLQYTSGMKGLRWSANGEAIECGDGKTFAFPGEIRPFLEGFLAQRPLIHFAHILHLLCLLKESRTPFLGRNEELMPKAFSLAQRPYRNAGLFCALLCNKIPSVPDPPLMLSTDVFVLEAGASEPFFTLQNGDIPPLPPVVFEARVLFALSSHSFEEILHWFQYGRGPVQEAGEEIAQTVLLDKPRSLHGALAELIQRPRLSGAKPFVDQLVSALTLPPRRLQPLDLPLGGYSDVTTHGHVDQLLPSQFAFDDLDFVRRYAERELLYFRREEPNVPTREDLVVLLDQSVRTWGSVRLVLAAALFALGQLAERRRIPFSIAATSGDGALLDLLQIETAELHELIESSDLSPHPAAALERVLSEETPLARDIVLLTHPRNLDEPEVIAAAKRLHGDARLFAVAVNEQGTVELREMRNGASLPLSRFHVDLRRTAPPLRETVADPLTRWSGDVEPIPYPFRFGLADAKSLHFAFDAAGDWLLAATRGGFLYAIRTDGSHTEILPRGLVQGAIVSEVTQVIGVAGGFVVVSVQANQLFLLHYDFSARTCTAHRFAQVDRSLVPEVYYFRKLHTVVVRQKNDLSCIHLSTGDRKLMPAVARIRPQAWSHRRLQIDPLPLQGEGGPDTADAEWMWPKIAFDAGSGTIRLYYTSQLWGRFTPLSDNRPLLKGCKLVRADCQNRTLAALFVMPSGSIECHLFRGPEGIPFFSYSIRHDTSAFAALSSDGRLLAHQVGRGHVQIHNLLAAKIPQHVVSVGRFHPQIQVQLGTCWLSLRVGHLVHLLRWKSGRLYLSCGEWNRGFVATELQKAGISDNGSLAAEVPLPDFLPRDEGKRFRWVVQKDGFFAAVSRFGEVALFSRSGELLCMFFAFRRQIAGWMPDGTCYGPAALLGRPATPEALDKIGAVLWEAWQGGERTVV